ncbi:MAG: hypothetical protein HWN79_04215 [Candidatus Lokiarchaeota archaeon]|nr:hypothetical protein [Candidatus Lokiarchaeota archaeon]
MNKTNCLIIDDNINDKKKENPIKTPKETRIDITNWNRFQTYNFEDYDVFFIDFEDYHRFDYDQTNALRKLISGELAQIKFIFASKIDSVITQAHQRKEETSDIISSLWSGIPPSIITKGNKIVMTNPKYNLSKLLFNEKNQPYHWKWAIQPKDLPSDSYVLAKNKKGNIISLIVRLEKNFLIFLPQPTLKRDFIETCLANIDKFELELYKRGFDLAIKKPKWLKDYDRFDKKSLVEESLEINEKIKRIESYEILLYGYDKPLEKTISKIFSFLGFQNIRRTVDRTDLFCETENTKILAEIKGLEKIAHEKNISQMYKWHAEELEKEKEEESMKRIKQIFICNAYRNKKPEERGSFFDKTVIKKSESQEWGLLSTLELYNALLKIWNGELTKEQVTYIIENQIGILTF